MADRLAAIAGWLSAAPRTDAVFPPATLTPDARLAGRADAALSDVRVLVERMGADALVYFDSSRPRYEACLVLALEGPPGPVLDIGCSPGHLAIALAKEGYHVSGTDLNAAWRPKYPPGWAERLHVQEVRFEEQPLPFPDASFALVMFTEVLEHVGVTDPVVVLREIRRTLMPGGTLILSTPNVANVSNILALALGRNVFWPPDLFYGSLDRHNREYTPAEVVALVESAGFGRCQIGYTNTWSNWNAATAPDIVRMLGERAAGAQDDPLFANTILVRATR